MAATGAAATGRGAGLPYAAYEAEAGVYEGAFLGGSPGRTFGCATLGTGSAGRARARLAPLGRC
ncbi:hypothetical protein, partial [Streptomyces sp. DSM 41029]